MDIYIYYRVHQDHAAILHERVSYMQRVLNTTFGVVSELKRRPETTEGYHTWMEIYLHTPEHFVRHIESAIEHAGVKQFIDGARHVEYFVGANPCA